MRLSLSPAISSLAFFLASLFLPSEVRAVTFNSAPSPNLDLSSLGRVALTGSFDSISLYQYLGQNEDGLHTNGSQSILARYPNGDFANVASADASISTMCPFVRDGQLQGIIIGGNFTGIAHQEAQAAVLFDPATGAITPLPGLSGSVNSVYCDSGSGTVYFGGSFSGGNSTNALAWTDNWTNLPFAGFNGPVSAIAPLSNGHVVFGGSFTGIGKTTTPRTPDAQTVNVGSANISSGPNTTTLQAYSDPRNIICRENNQTGDGWLLQDGAGGFWRADFGFFYNPTKLRLLNSQFPNRGVKTFRLTAFPGGGIMNLTYFDQDGPQSCISECPLMQGNQSYQDFYFVNTVGMNGWQIDITQWYGDGAGLAGIELFQDDIYSFAINDYNEPHCDDVSNGSNSTVNGPWERSPTGISNSQYLTYFQLANGEVDSDLSVVFEPDIKQSGNYSVTVYTPGCLADQTCDTRGQANITGSLTNPSGTNPSQPISTTVSQTNNFDKYDEVYYGFIDATASNFRPSVTLSPSSGQNGPLTIVAQRVRFELKNSTGGLNGLFEYDPSRAQVDTDFSKSAIDSAGTRLDDGAHITSLVVINDVTYAAGNFTSDSASHIMAIDGGQMGPLAGGGLNQAVQTMFNPDETMLYVGGNFTNTQDNSSSGLNNLAAYSIQDKTWQALGAGVNGPVWNIIPVAINISSNQQENTIAVSGYFDQIIGFDQNAAIPVQNIAVWIPSRKNWLQNVASHAISLSGQFNAYTAVPDSDPLFAGTVDSQFMSVSGTVGLQSQNGLGLQQLPINVQPSNAGGSTAMRKRAPSQEPTEGVVTGLFYGQNGLNITALGGHFQAQASNGSVAHNLILINGSNNDQIVGLTDASSSQDTILAMDYHDSTLYAGGDMPTGFIAYDLVQASPSQIQPPSLDGGSGIVQAIAARPSSPVVFFGGSFKQAGSLPCPALCIYDTSAQQWTNPAAGISDDSVINSMTWASRTRLIIAGNMSINGNQSTMVSYDAKAQKYSAFEGSGNSVPGPIMVFSATDDTYKSFFVAGTSQSGSAFISKFTSSSSSSAGQIGGKWADAAIGRPLGPATSIGGLQMLRLGKHHAPTNLVGQDVSLLVTGLLELPGFGNASAALFNGTTFEPLALSTTHDGNPGTLRKTFVEHPQNLLSNRSSNRLAVGFIVLIALAIALALIFLIVVIGILAERYRRRREGYVPAPTGSPGLEKNGGNVGNITAERLFGGVGNGGGNG